jgi:hypothetical protein
VANQLTLDLLDEAVRRLRDKGFWRAENGSNLHLPETRINNLRVLVSAIPTRERVFPQPASITSLSIDNT